MVVNAVYSNLVHLHTMPSLDLLKISTMNMKWNDIWSIEWDPHTAMKWNMESYHILHIPYKISENQTQITRDSLNSAIMNKNFKSYINT